MTSPAIRFTGITKRFPGAVALVSIGCGADQNPDSGVTGDKVETAKVQGRQVAEEVKRAAARHQNRGNVAFCDGHVEALTFKRLFLDRDDGSLRRWNRDNEPHR